MKEKYNWWTDPKNKEAVEKASWWNKPENQSSVELPISITNEGGMWVVCTNDKTKELFGDYFHGLGQGETKDDAIKSMFIGMKSLAEFLHEERLSSARFVPFTKGDWKYIGGRWFTIFGIHFSFRKGDGNKGGWYIPFTKLNISIISYWKTYRDYKRKYNSL